jgi:hypothetical protein
VSERYQVKRSPVAAKQLAKMHDSATLHPGTAHEAVWDAHRRVIEQVLPEPDLVFSPKHRCGVPNVYRVKVGQRSRLFYIASSKLKCVALLYIGFRKEGDKGDAYTEIRREIGRGTFDAQFSELGVDKPT